MVGLDICRRGGDRGRVRDVQLDRLCGATTGGGVDSSRGFLALCEVAAAYQDVVGLPVGPAAGRGQGLGCFEA